MKTPTNKTIQSSMMMILFFALASFTVNAQTYKVNSGSEINVAGTSNMHDWNMNAKAFTCDAVIVLKGGALSDVSSLSFTLPVANLKSKDKLMDTRAYKALKTDAHKNITFKLKDATILPQQKVKVVGNLTIAGVTKEISFISSYVVNSDQSVTFKATESLKMSDYGIKPPSFMMGALKVGDPVTINLQLKFNK